METLAYLYHAEAYATIATKSVKKSRKNGQSRQATVNQESSDVAYFWMP